MSITKPFYGNYLMHIRPERLIDARIFFTGDYEPEVKQIFKALIREGQTVLDVGANIGVHTLFFSTLVGGHGKVISCEPSKANQRALADNIVLNGFTNIELLPYALGLKDETLYLNSNNDDKNPGAFSIAAGGNEAVVCKQGDALLSSMGIDKVDFIKVDVEGYEWFVLQGLQQSIQSMRPKIMFEFDDNYQQRAHKEGTDLLNLIRSWGYQLFVIKEQGLQLLAPGSKCVNGQEILALPIALLQQKSTEPE